MSTSMRGFGKHRAVLAHCLAFLAVLAAIPAMASASPGDLDPSFGKSGKVTRPASFGRDVGRTNVATLPEGGVVVLAGRTLYGFRADGSIARGFGGGSVRVTNPTGEVLQLLDLAVDSRGRVLVAGGLGSGLDSSESPERVFVARFTRRGQPDPSFGANGVVVTDLGLPGRMLALNSFAPNARVRATGIVVDPADRVVLTGTRLSSIGPCRGHINLSYREAFVARLDSGGQPDPAFGDAGVASLAKSPKIGENINGEALYAYIQAINPPVVDASGNVYFSTLPTGPCGLGETSFVGRLDSSGRTDSTFAERSWVQVSGGVDTTAPVRSFLPSSLALDRAGRLLLIGRQYANSAAPGQPEEEGGRWIVAVKRVLPRGVVDPSFGRRGIARMAAPFSLGGGTIDRSDRVLIAGTRRGAFLVGRFTSQGQIDRGFGRLGRTTTSFGSQSPVTASSVATDPRGRAVIAGIIASPRLPGGKGLALARYEGGR
jgi:uncharacterized delta-60 repeat protein